ncbi:MAG: hypothetical protein WBD40_08830 [Tepidisphaeraceae bacterium]
MAKQTKPKPSALERAIASRQRGIDRMRQHKKRIMDEALWQCAQIDQQIAEKQVLLDAVKSGQLTTERAVLSEARERGQLTKK